MVEIERIPSNMPVMSPEQRGVAVREQRDNHDSVIQLHDHNALSEVRRKLLKERLKLIKDIAIDTIFPRNFKPIPHYSNRTRAVVRLNRTRIGCSFHTIFALHGIDLITQGDTLTGLFVLASNTLPVGLTIAASFNSPRKVKRLLTKFLI